MAEHELLLPAGHRRYSKSQSKRVRTPEGYSQRTAKGRARPCCLPASGVGVEGGMGEGDPGDVRGSLGNISAHLLSSPPPQTASHLTSFFLP